MKNRLRFAIPHLFAFCAALASAAAFAQSGSLQFSTTPASGNEGGVVSFAVSRVGGSAGAVAVDFATADGTAIAGFDYTASSGTLSWADGDVAVKVFSVAVASDDVAEDGETFHVLLSNPQGPPDVDLGDPDTATGIIRAPWPRGDVLPPGFFTETTPKGDAWTVQSDEVYEGVFSIRSGSNRNTSVIGFAFGDSSIRYTGEFVAGTLSFAYKVRFGEVSAFLTLQLDDELIHSDDGMEGSGWKLFTYEMPAGTHTLRWRFGTSGGSQPGEFVWIDAVVLPLASTVPGAPLIGTAVPGNTTASVSFSPPASDGGAPILDYQVTCGTAVKSGPSSPVVVTGLGNFTSYSCSARARNSVGLGPASGSVNVTPTPIVGGPPRLRYDFNGDKRSDVLWRDPAGVPTLWHLNGANLTGGDVQIVSNGTVTVGAGFSVVGVGDFNGDGRADILLRNPVSGANRIWHLDGSVINAGKVKVVSIGSLPSRDNTWSVIGIGDFNGDGKSDVMWRDPTGAPVIWHLNGETITAGAIQVYNEGSLSVSAGFSVQAIGDFNGDGKSDVLWRKESSGSNRIWHLDGRFITSGKVRVVSAGSLPSLAGSWSVAGVGDFNGDGKSDILWRDPAGQGQAWHVNGASIVAGQVTVISTGTVSTAAGFVVAGVGDYDGDGKSDVLFRNPTSGSNRVWHLDGAVINAGKIKVKSAGNLPSRPSSWTPINTR